MKLSEQQPLKKRRLFEASSSPSVLGNDDDDVNVQCPSTPPLSEEEIKSKRNNKNEIVAVYDAYKRLKSCIVHKENGFSEIEHAYLFLVNASKGCASVQRILADFIPRYASHSLNNLEASAAAVTGMCIRALSLINEGRDCDGVAFHTAVSCFTGLVEVCNDAITSKANLKLYGICAIVFRHILSFFITSLQGTDVFNVHAKQFIDMDFSVGGFKESKDKVLEENEEKILTKVTKLQMLCFLHILHRWPKEILSACFEMYDVSSPEVDRGVAMQFICLLAKNYNDDPSKVNTNKQTTCTTEQNESQMPLERLATSENSKNSVACILQTILHVNVSLRYWVFLNLKKLTDNTEAEKSQEIKSSLDASLEICKMFLIRNSKECNEQKDHSQSKGLSHNEDCIDYKEDRSTSPELGSSDNPFVSSKHPIVWLCEGEIATMDVFPASTQLWFGYFSSEVCESQIRYQTERFGFVQQFFFFPLKGFAIVEFRSLVEAVRCREYMRSYWQTQVKFIDSGINATVCSSIFVYVGSVYSQWEKDIAIHEATKVVPDGPKSTTELVSEGALLLEFETAKEAAYAMAQIRHNRQERSNFSLNESSSRAMCETGNVSGLSSFVSCLRKKYNIVGHVSNAGVIGEPSNTLWVYLQNPCDYSLSDEDITGIILAARKSTDFIIKLCRGQTRNEGGYGWLVVMNSIDAASFVLQNILSCPEMFLSVEFSNGTTTSSGVIVIEPPAPLVQPPVYGPGYGPWNLPHCFPMNLGQHCFERSSSGHVIPMPPLPPLPPPPDSPPPPPPPPPSSPPPAPYQWQCVLCKSGIRFCSINVARESSDNSKYSSDISEPTGWPAKLDMTKRTDFKHVKSSFKNTLPSRREVCLLTPSCASDRKGFDDFVGYLKQRECAGVIKIPVAKAIWSRLLFILPYSNEVCTLVGISPSFADCLVCLVLPKETNFEWS